jgi:hypothetical protein
MVWTIWSQVALALVQFGFLLYANRHAATAALAAKDSVEVAREGIRIADEGMKAAERAYLAVERWQVTRNVKGIITILSCDLLNTGRTPATLLACDLHTDVRRELPPVPNYQDLPKRDLEQITIGSGRDMTLRMSSPIDFRLTPEQIGEAINAGRVLLYFYGCIAYVDVFGCEHQTAFFTRYDPQLSILMVVNAPGYNYST